MIGSEETGGEKRGEGTGRGASEFGGPLAKVARGGAGGEFESTDEGKPKGVEEAHRKAWAMRGRQNLCSGGQDDERARRRVSHREASTAWGANRKESARREAM